MSLRKKILTLLAIVLVTAIFALCLHHEKEPTYEGKRLTEWLPLLINFENPAQRADNGQQRRDAMRAIEEIGADGLPILVHLIAYDHNRDLLFRLSELLPDHIKQAAMLRPIRKKDAQALEAETALRYLGVFGAPAVPSLVKIVEEGKEDPARRAIETLDSLGDSGVRALADIESRTNSHTPISVRQYLALRKNWRIN